MKRLCVAQLLSSQQLVTVHHDTATMTHWAWLTTAVTAGSHGNSRCRGCVGPLTKTHWLLPSTPGDLHPPRQQLCSCSSYRAIQWHDGFTDASRSLALNEPKSQALFCWQDLLRRLNCHSVTAFFRLVDGRPTQLNSLSCEFSPLNQRPAQPAWTWTYSDRRNALPASATKFGALQADKTGVGPCTVFEKIKKFQRFQSFSVGTNLKILSTIPRNMYCSAKFWFGTISVPAGCPLNSEPASAWPWLGVAESQTRSSAALEIKVNSLTFKLKRSM
jgi:hypothetical protein